MLNEGLEKMGLELCVKISENRLHAVTPFVTPSDVPRDALLKHLLEK